MVGIVLCAASLLALAVLLYRMPHTSRSVWGLNYPGAEHFREKLPFQVSQVDKSLFVPLFRLFLGSAWLGYAMAVAAGYRGGTLRGRHILAVAAPVCLVVAFVFPACLSCDSYGYAAYARLHVIYGRNPYADSPLYLISQHDPIARFLVWNIPSMYGPLWTLFTCAVVSVLRSAGLWCQIVAFKLAEAVALIVAALAGRKITKQLSPGRENLTLPAILLNPLFLIEGPGSGHNDIMMMCLFLVSVSLYMKKRYTWSFVFLGLSVAVKFLTLAAFPWMLILLWQGRPLRQRFAAAAGGSVLAVAPTVVSFLPFWQGAATLSGIHDRWAWGQGTLASAQQRMTEPLITSHVTAGVPEQMGQMFLHQWPLMAVFLILTLWLLLRRDVARLLLSWSAISAFILYYAAGCWFPWYLAWPWLALLIQWDRLRIRLFALSVAIGCTFTMLYSVGF